MIRLHLFHHWWTQSGLGRSGVFLLISVLISTCARTRGRQAFSWQIFVNYRCLSQSWFQDTYNIKHVTILYLLVTQREDLLTSPPLPRHQTWTSIPVKSVLNFWCSISTWISWCDCTIFLFVWTKSNEETVR